MFPFVFLFHNFFPSLLIWNQSLMIQVLPKCKNSELVAQDSPQQEIQGKKPNGKVTNMVKNLPFSICNKVNMFGEKGDTKFTVNFLILNWKCQPNNSWTEQKNSWFLTTTWKTLVLVIVFPDLLLTLWTKRVHIWRDWLGKYDGMCFLGRVKINLSLEGGSNYQAVTLPNTECTYHTHPFTLCPFLST